MIEYENKVWGFSHTTVQNIHAYNVARDNVHMVVNI